MHFKLSFTNVNEKQDGLHISFFFIDQYISQGRHPVDFFAATKLNFYVILNPPPPPPPTHTHCTEIDFTLSFGAAIVKMICPKLNPGTSLVSYLIRFKAIQKIVKIVAFRGNLGIVEGTGC